ncbi:MAG: lytic murein transglycosylase B [Candidatus Sedimenticola endophacoides]|uniref:Lytic murein transglycosylase B n=1 Tax=Candidatus Sedimenticola endophacoides TaxID=2548426 RepID=A0A6N4DX81_9GAMM|nr:MAG: lytic murein transglycosylase B [Candidatus Sedimenticola endophacoides]OQX35903.1 MAG: lytic murein transglycosylase B [Candidatus Sedimenticola endophacoides]OQX40719.1 MAG: lytic murein transglycosylase B [Candidatus Sedimenticola endophacoides]PUD99843.1 MAG: lytic murein transglycosylase B [Candidatus Sedimenticola endophacoides]PUE02252.1 MAG: lytic murein transglycosylase B [Candidatus Sedimenticola endophacoides]
MDTTTLKTALLGLLIAGATPAALAGPPPGFEQEIAGFIQRMADKHGFETSHLREMITPGRYRQGIVDAISRPSEAKPWHQYRPIFVTDSRTRQGVEFWNENQTLLSEAEARYGVPAEIIVAIIGVESRYGRHTGSYPVLDALTTLGFGYPRRGKFFQGELEAFLLLCQEEGLDPAQAQGSYAGALGQAQFIPSSYRAYAIDFDRDGKRDLWHNNADVIGSVAAYFKDHGWRPGEPVTHRLEGGGKAHHRFSKAGMKPSLTLSELREAGIELTTDLPGDTLASLVRLKLDRGEEYWLGLHNFYVITRYNHSNHYAMAVYQLSRAIRQARAEADPS